MKTKNGRKVYRKKLYNLSFHDLYRVIINESIDLMKYTIGLNSAITGE